MKRYAIWDKVSPIITPIGEVLTAEQWMNRYPVARVDSVSVVCAAGEINGGFFATLGQMVQTYEAMGCDFSKCTTPEDKIDAIEAFDEAKEAEAKAAEEEARAKAEAEAQAQADLAEREVVALEAMASGATSESTAVVNALLGEDEGV